MRQLCDQILIDLQSLSARGGILQLDAAFQFTARHGRGNLLAQRAFQIAQLFRHTELDIQITMVDCADFQINPLAAAFACGIGKAGHAVDLNISSCSHGFTPFSNTSESTDTITHPTDDFQTAFAAKFLYNSRQPVFYSLKGPS